MTVPAQRFKFLDEETNVPVSNFLSNMGSGILNGPLKDIVSVTEELQAIVSGDKPVNVDKILRTIANGGLSTSRLTKDFYSTLSDLSRSGTKAIGQISKRLFPNSTILQGAFNQMGEGCKNKLLSGLSQCRNKKQKARHKGKLLNTTNRSCSADSFINLINKLTNGVYNATHVDQCALMKMVAGVAIRGFEIGLPAVFSSLSGQIEDKHLLAQTGNMVLGAVAIDKNMNAVMDIANSDIGSMIFSQNPNVASNVLSNFKLPSEIMPRDVPGFYGDFSGAMSTLDPNWLSGKFGDLSIPSVSSMLGSSAGDLKNMFSSAASADEIQIPGLDGFVPPLSTESLIAAGLEMTPYTPDEALNLSFSDLPMNLSETVSSVTDYQFI